MALATDDFNRADAGSLGANWTDHVAGMKIAGNLATPVNSGPRQWSSHVVSVGADQYSQAVIAAGSATAGYDSYITARMSGTGASTDGYAISFGDAWGGAVRIVRIEGGNLAVLQTTGASVAVGDIVRVEVEGTDVRAYKNGVQIGTTQSDSTYASGSVGIGGAFTGYDNFDNWEGGDLSSSVSSTPSAGALTFAGLAGFLGFAIHLPDEA